MNILYDVFYRQFGIRKIQQLITPRTRPLSALKFPRNAIFHFVSHDENVVGPDESMPYFAEFSKRLPTYDVDALTSLLGSPKKRAVAGSVLFRPFHNRYKKFKYTVKQAMSMTDPMTLEIFNYGFLTKLYRYTELKLTPYFKWFNIEKTVYDTVLQTIRENDRQHFVMMTLPAILPSITSLKMFGKNVNQVYLNIFDTPEKKFILELWKWLGEETRSTSLLADYKLDDLNKLNLIIINNGYWSVLNLGYIEQWRRSESTKGVKGVVQFDPVQIQKFFIRSLIQIQSSSGAAEPIDDEIIEEKKVTVPDENTETDEIDDDDEPEIESPPDLPDDKISLGFKIKSTKEIREIDDLEIQDVDTSVDVINYDEIDKELEVLDHIETKNLQLRGISRIDKMIEVKDPVISFDATNEELDKIADTLFTEKSITTVLKASIDKQAEYGVMTASEYKATLKLVDNFKQMKDPFTGKETIEQFATVTPDDLSLNHDKNLIPDNLSVVDKSMLKSTLVTFDAKYVEKVLPKDTVAMAINLQKAGMIIQDYDVELVESMLGSYEIHTLKIKPIDGVSSTLRFKLPKVNEEGDFVANGNKYKMRKQRVDLPIRKINPFTVALTSYYGKLFVQRSDKVANKSVDWLIKQLMSLGMSGESKHITAIAPANVFDNNFKAPQIYSALAHSLKTMTIGPYQFNFDHKDRFNYFKPSTLKGLTQVDQVTKIESNGQYVICGVTEGKPVLVDYDNQFYRYDGENKYQPLGGIYGISLIDQTQAPVDYSELKIYSKVIPVGVVLAYTIGFVNLIKLLKLKPAIYEPRQKVSLKSDEYMLVFKDKKLVFSRKDRFASLIIGGFASYKKVIKNFHLDDFNEKNVYLNILETQGISARYLRELDLLDQLFIDPITRDILKEMKEPLTFSGLIMRGTELLLVDYHPDTQDMAQMRVRGYERFAGAVYREMIGSIREFKSRNIRGKSQIDLNPYAVWRNVTHDASVEFARDINPIQYLKSIESITYVGEGGRAKDAMSKPSRAYHVNDIGVISEATVDSSDVGINAYLSADPKFTGLRGVTERYDFNKDGATSLLSTSALTSVGADTDDAKRVNFISIQQAHTVSTKGYRQPYVRTGYEQVIPQRTGDMFAYTAKEKGKVISVTELGIVFEYESGLRKGIELGRRYGRAEGSVYPHDIISPLKEGDLFEPGDPIAYNTGFFEPDILNPRNIIMKSSLPVKTAFFESKQTFEDSSSISKRLSNELRANTTKVRSFVVNFTQGIKNIVKLGTLVEPMDTLFLIEDEVTEQSDIFDEATIETLKRLSNKAPKAKVKGVVDRIEVYYHGNKEDMTISLRNIANQSDRLLGEIAKSSNKTNLNGSVTDEYRVMGTPLALDTAEIKVYVTIETPAGIGD